MLRNWRECRDVGNGRLSMLPALDMEEDLKMPLCRHCAHTQFLREREESIEVALPRATEIQGGGVNTASWWLPETRCCYYVDEMDD